MNNQDNKILRSLLAIIVGVLIAIIIIFPILYIVALLSFSDEKLPKSQQLFNTILWLCGIAGGSFFGGYFTSKISLKYPLVHSTLTGLVLTFLYLLISNFDLRYFPIEELISIPLFVIFTILGAYLYTKMKKSNVKNDSSLPGNS